MHEFLSGQFYEEKDWVQCYSEPFSQSSSLLWKINCIDMFVQRPKTSTHKLSVVAFSDLEPTILFVCRARIHLFY